MLSWDIYVYDWRELLSVKNGALGVWVRCLQEIKDIVIILFNK